MPETGILVSPLVDGSDINDPTNKARLILDTYFGKVKQQDGFLSYHLGMQVQNPNVLETIISWESQKHFEVWQANPEFGPAMKEVSSLIAAKGDLYKVNFEPHEESLKALSAPITEMVRFYFDGDAPETYFDDFKKAGEKLREDGVQGIVATAAGITHEDHEYDGVKGKVAIVVVGWESLEHHMDFLKSQTMQETSLLLRSSSKAIKFNHVNFTIKGHGVAQG